MISTHILDTSLGHPAAGVVVNLEKFDNGRWNQIFKEETNSDGRVKFQSPHHPGIYKLVFEVEEYFKNNKIVPFFLNVPVIFEISNITRSYHVPLLLNPYGYSTYRGS